MMSGPLSRLCASSDLLQLEDEASIPWTYVGSNEADQVDDDAAVVTYTTEGAKKRRKMSRKRNESSDIKPSKPLDSDFQDWTEEEEFSLCQAVAIALQKTSFQNNSSSSTDLQTNIPTQATLRRELQKVNLSKVLVGCFVSNHEYEDVVTRVRSTAFCRMFTGFSHSKAERHQHVASLVKTDAEADSSSCGNGIDARDASQDEEREKPGEASSKAKHRTVIKGKRLHSDSMEQVQMQAEVQQTHDEQASRTERVQGETKKEQGSSGVSKRKETCHPMKRSSSRLKSKQHHPPPVESTDQTQVGDREDKSTPKLFSPVHVVGEIELPVVKSTRRGSIDLNCELKTSGEAHEKKQRAVKTETCPTRGAPANSELRTIQRQGRNKKSLRRPAVEDQSAKEPSNKVDLSVKSSQEIQVEVKTVASHAPQPTQKTKNGQKREATKAIAESVEESQCSTGPPLAALRNSQQNTKDEKRSFKSFRKKLLDRCLEVQNSTLSATGKVPSLRCSDASKLHLDEYLTMQQVQQGRKSVLDACLLAQRDVR